MNSQHSAYPATGEVIDGKYQIERMLGEGGMGAVAKATHLLRRAPVALKFMSPNVMSFPGAVERFLNEGVAASQIDSDHVVHIFDVGKLPNGAPYLVMEYMEGQDLSELLAREQAAGKQGIEVTRAIYFIVQTLRGLQVAHDAGIIHRDMKPSNCFVINKEGEADFVKLLDFGISKVGGGKSASLTQTNSALGTPLYMSPEQAKSPRDVDLRSDLYSVGVILYELLTGRTPFNSESGEFTEILFKLFTQDPPPIRSLLPDLPAELAAVVHRALVRDPNERFSTAAEFGLALGPWADVRSARVLNRLSAHQPGRGSVLPHDSLHPQGGSVAAFSKLGTGVRQEMSPSGVSPPAQSQVAQQTPARHSAYPVQQEARATGAGEAVAATQYHASASQVAVAPGVGQPQLGKQTDLGAARDTSVAHAPIVAKRPSPFVFVIPAFVVLGIGAAGAWKLTHSPPAAGGAMATPDTPTVSALPVVTAPVTTAAPILSAAPAPSVDLPDAAVAPANPPPRKNAAAQGGTPTSTPQGNGKVHLKDLKPVE